MRFQFSLLAIFSAIGFVSAASAADMPLKARPVPVAAASYNWTGWYVGGHVGYGWDSNGTTIGITDPSGLATAAAAAGAIPVIFSDHPKGALGGLQIGYNHQISPNWVLGAETDFSFSGVDGSQTINTAVPTFFPLTSSVAQDLSWFGTLRARLGYAANNWLFYGTGGGAYGHVKYTYALSNVAGGGPVNITAADSQTQWGWTIGGGVEYGWSNWTLRAEYLYVNLGDHLFNAPLNTLPTTIFTSNFENKFSIVRASVNYRF
jgi:outer membrane immunogenic protein